MDNYNRQQCNAKRKVQHTASIRLHSFLFNAK